MKLFENLFVRKDVVELKERLDKLERIMKYSKPDGPSFRIVNVCDDEDIEYMKLRGVYTPGSIWYKSAYILYLYIDNEEYEINLGREIDRHSVACKKLSKIEVYGGLAHLELYNSCVDYNTVLTVDYKKGKFVSEIKAKVVIIDEEEKNNGKCEEIVGLVTSN